jgi:hypothetical protein
MTQHRERLNIPRRLGCQVIAAYILIQTQVGTAAMAAALRAFPGTSDLASLAGPYNVIAQAPAREDIGELAKLVTSGVPALDGVTPAVSSPAVHL